MQHNLFHPNTVEQAKDMVVGNCNGFSMEKRWEIETPLFAKAINNELKFYSSITSILDYGCGTGRLAKEVLNQNPHCEVVGVDASSEMLERSKEYVNSNNFSTYLPSDLSEDKKFDLVYCVYVLQHAPAIELREILARIYHHLKDAGVFVYCSSDYRMAIRFDGGGFFDDRFLGVNLREEIERFFEPVKDLFTKEELSNNEVLNKMIAGADNGLAHPAIVYKKKKLIGQYFNANNLVNNISNINKELGKNAGENIAKVVIDSVKITKKEYTKLVLVNRLAPGDILVMTNAIRDLHKAYPGKYQVAVKSACNPIFDNNPYISNFQYDNTQADICVKMFSDNRIPEKYKDIGNDTLCIDMQYPSIHKSGVSGKHFSEGHREYLEDVLRVKIPQTDIRPEIYLTQSERDWINPVFAETGFKGKYWVINAGSKNDFALKQYPFYQEVVDILKDKIQFVQIGEKSHNHIPIRGALDMLGKTNVRQLFRVIYKSQGVLTCVSFPMHIAAAFSKSAVVVAGGREPVRWEMYPNHQYLYVNGVLTCAPYDGCWKNTIKDCLNNENGVPKCMKMIKPIDVANKILAHYEGGILQF